jgi:hypothetical protein
VIPESLYLNTVFAIGFIVFAFFVILFFMVLEAKSKEPKLKPKEIFAFFDKYSMVFGVVFVIIGAVFLIPYLTPWGVNIFWFDWFIKNYFWFIRLSLFLTGILLLVIGLILNIRYMRHSS